MESKVITSPLKAVRLKCLDCCCGSSKEVSLCPAEDCPLYHFRSGHSDLRKKREISADERAAAVERMTKARQARIEKNL